LTGNVSEKEGTGRKEATGKRGFFKGRGQAKKGRIPGLLLNQKRRNALKRRKKKKGNQEKKP